MMDFRLIEHLLQWSPEQFHEAISTRERRRKIAALRAGVSLQGLAEPQPLRMMRFFVRIVEDVYRIREMIEETLRALVGSAPPRTIPHCSPYLRVPMLSVPALPEPAGLTHAPHAPPQTPPARSSAAFPSRGRSHRHAGDRLLRQ